MLLVDPGVTDGTTLGAVATAIGIALATAAWLRDRYFHDKTTIPDESHEMTESWRLVALDAISRLDDCEEQRDLYRERLAKYENVV